MLIGILAFCLLTCRERLMTPAEFTQAHVSALREKYPDVKVEVFKDLELRINRPADTSQTSLQRSYEAYMHEPERLAELVGRFVNGQAVSFAKPSRGVAMERIVPVIKSRKWLATMQKTVYEDFSPDLVIVYGEDHPDHPVFGPGRPCAGWARQRESEADRG